MVSSTIFSQEKIPFIDSAAIVQEISREESSTRILALINKVSENDSLYSTLLTSKSYYLLQLEKYEEALVIANEGLNIFNGHSKVNLYVNKGVALANLKRSDEALENYDKGIQAYPKNYLLWYNRGYILETQGKVNEALRAYKTAIALNPSYKNPHLQIGNIYYKQERLSQALMCFNMYLLLEPDASGAFSTLKSLNNIVQSQNTNKKDPTVLLDDDSASFEELDLVLSSKLAMNKNYKTGNPINIALVQQNHAMLTQLENYKGTSSFWDKTYVPFYKWVVKNNKFNTFIYTLTFSIENEGFKKIIQNNTKEIRAFSEELKEKWTEIMSKNTIFFNGRQQKVTYQYGANYVDAVGVMADEIPVGFWQFYGDSGSLTAEGNFDTMGNRAGAWVWYTSLHNIKERAFYKKGVLNGRNLMFYQNQKNQVNAMYKNDSLHGEYAYFRNTGALSQRKYFTGGNLDSIYKSYFKVGEKLLEYYIPYEDGQIDGDVLEYYANGDLYQKVRYVSDEKQGLEVTFFYNKRPSSEIYYVNGKLDGSYKSYHLNGKIFEVGQSRSGASEGSWKTYYSNGILQSDAVYEKGKLTDNYQYYDMDGILHYTYRYKKGDIIAYTFYNKDGSVLRAGKKKGGEFYYEGFSPKGNITSAGLYDISGGKTGEWKFYTDNGVLSNEGTFTENKIEGDYFNYYKNGNIAFITPYKEGSINGYYKAYHPNKQISTQGWYKEGNQHGEWRYYYRDGTLQAINFFHKGLLHGLQKYFGVNGKLSSSLRYEYNALVSENIYGKDEVLFEKVKYTSEDKEYKKVTKHYNNKLKTSSVFVNEVKHGAYGVFYFNGNKKIVGTFHNGAQNGLWTWYYENGSVESEVNYLNDKVHGKVINYYKNGQVQGDYSYDNDLEVELSTEYYESGNNRSIVTYYEGKKHGRQEFFGPLGKLQLIHFYSRGKIIGYSYLDTSGVEKAMIPILRETGKIVAYFDNGQVSKIMEYRFGDLINKYKVYAYDGTLIEAIEYVYGKYNGAKKEYFVNGKLKKETHYIQGQKQGKQVHYFESGAKREVFTFVNDLAHGASFFYNEEGKLKTKKEYFNGKVYAVENL